MKRACILALALATTPACSLLLDPNAHTGHERDSSTLDGGGSDGGGSDGGGTDGGGTLDSGPHDGGPDAWAPPECTTAADCGAAGTAGLVQCVSSRCVFCATPTTPMPHEVRHGAMLQPNVSIGIRRRPTGPALVLVGTVGTDAATLPLAHSAPIDAPSTVTDVPILAAAQTSCSSSALTTLSSIEFFPDPYASSTSTIVGVVGQGANGSAETLLYWTDTADTFSSSGTTCNREPSPGSLLASSTMLGAAGTDSNHYILHMVRESDGMGDYSYLAYAYPDGSRMGFYNGFMSPTTPYALMSSAGPFMVLQSNDPATVVWWDPEGTGGLSFVSTPGRTGDATGALLTGSSTMADELLHFTMAYPVGNIVRFVDLDCTGMCSPVGEALDTTTDAMAVTAARFGLSSGVPVLLTSEHLADGTEQVVLRVLRADHAGFDAPGGGTALVLDTIPAGSTVSDIELAVVDGTTTRYAAVWVVTSSADTSVRLQTFGSCS